MAQAFVELEAQAEASNLAHAEWLALLLDREAANRGTKRFQTRLRAAQHRKSKRPRSSGFANRTSQSARRAPPRPAAIRPEQLLSALLLCKRFTASGRNARLMEQLDYNLLYRR